MSEPQPAETGVTASGLEFNRWLVLFALVAVPVMVALGFWQLARAEQKVVALAIDAERAATGPIGIVQLEGLDPASMNLARVQLSGEYLGGRDFLLDNRINKGKVGYEVLTPFIDDSGITVLVNRGWVKAPPTRDQLPNISTVDGQLTLAAEVRVAPPDRRDLQLYAAPGWPKRIQAVDIAEMAGIVGTGLYPHVLLLQNGQPGAFVADWPVVNMSPDKHRAYALQWFLMAAALAVVTLFGGTNFKEWIKTRG